MEKITKREMYQALIRFAETGVMSYPAKEDGVDDPTVTSEELKAFAENEIILLDKKLNKAKENAKKKQARIIAVKLFAPVKSRAKLKYVLHKQG